MPEFLNHFPTYTEFDPAVPVWCITPGEGRCFHRFFDTSPVSPSGRYVALTRLPFENHMPAPGDVAQVVLVDLQTGEERVVAETAGWDTQLGAQAQWGADDSQLCFNDVDTSEWRPFGVVLNPATGERKELQGTHYMVSPDGTKTASPCLLRTAITQAGYGVLAPDEVIPRNSGVPDDDGIHVTDLATGECRLIASLKKVVEDTNHPDLVASLDDSDFYAFHVKWNSQCDRIMLVLRVRPRDTAKCRSNLITMAADGSDIHVAIPSSEWGKGGHHPNWCPDGERVMMNLRYSGEAGRMVLVEARYDGSDYRPMTCDALGSGHPSLHPDGRHVVTDAYPGEPVMFDDRTSPLRLIDVADDTARNIVRINTVPAYNGPNSELRVDPHPAWDPTFTRIVFNACVGGTRRVFIADLTELLR